MLSSNVMHARRHAQFRRSIVSLIILVCLVSSRSKSGNNMEFLFESTSTSRPRNLSDAISPSHPAAPLAALIAKSVPGVSSPGSIDSSCSEYSTPPGSPEPRQSSSSKRGRAITGNQQQSQHSPAGNDSIQGGETDDVFSLI